MYFSIPIAIFFKIYYNNIWIILQIQNTRSVSADKASGRHPASAEITGQTEIIIGEIKMCSPANFSTVSLNRPDVSEYLKKYYNTDISHLSELTTKDIFNILVSSVKDRPFSEFLTDFLKSTNRVSRNADKTACIAYCTSAFEGSGITDAEPLFKNKSPLTAGLIKKLLKNWFENVCPSRENVFLLAFALKADLSELSHLLIKGIHSKDINYKNPEETAAATAIRLKKGYHFALKIMERASEKTPVTPPAKRNILTSSYKNAYEKLSTDEEICRYIADLIALKNDPRTSECISQCYKKLMNILSYYAKLDKMVSVENETGVKITNSRSISFGTIERFIYYYVPVKNGPGRYRTDSFAPYENGNIKGSSDNLMGERDWFFSTLLRRGDLAKMYRGTKQISRDVILTLSFFAVCEENPYYGTYEYISDINDYLNFCRFDMFDFSAPYDLFLFMCLQTDDPPASFRKIWELSWNKQTAEQAQ